MKERRCIERKRSTTIGIGTPPTHLEHIRGDTRHRTNIEVGVLHTPQSLTFTTLSDDFKEQRHYCGVPCQCFSNTSHFNSTDTPRPMRPLTKIKSASSHYRGRSIRLNIIQTIVSLPEVLSLRARRQRGRQPDIERVTYTCQGYQGYQGYQGSGTARTCLIS